MLDIKNLSVEFNDLNGRVKALTNINIHIEQGEIVGIVGESGSGKSVTALSILGLLDENAHISNGSIIYHDQNLLEMNVKDIQALRGKKIGMVFQEPMTALHPTMNIGQQLIEVIRQHKKVSKKEAYRLAIEALKDVHIHHPEKVAKQYPFELSGGMRQRVVIALAMSNPPELLIADEPTTALDVTIQSEILNLMKELNQKKSVSVLLITHDLGVVSQLCDRTIVMYAGQIVETGLTYDVLHFPKHPYTEALLNSLPDLKQQDQLLEAIPGEVPDLRYPPMGCPFHSRCKQAMTICREHDPKLDICEGNHYVACWLRRDEA
ncbi:ATP-binding cassette domain-containing protein [Terrilactibacillus sp. BCM23-1]|uniref:ATP-binding cassette domain-containing protein n=1 Tax=Terrilactibacillus tamarindi TaxID=2599694 RepID=A0A6N8CQH6_9BACI|nr:ABC transporter ATP-binding protein [Terrilactibacillus tamarindi]MTT31195.1 ATP-binding cassette domain-containing protein [Terrilactibacillus tamarindi]